MGAYLICPFAKYEQRFRIGCEACTITFNNFECKNKYMAQYCATFDYKKCIIAKVLMKHYGD